jgi:hypothetical protein
MADLTTLQTRLAEAETAYHRLMTGSLEESIGLGDMQVRYTRADMTALAVYIAQLKSDVDAAGGTSAGARRRAITVTL